VITSGLRRQATVLFLTAALGLLPAPGMAQSLLTGAIEAAERGRIDSAYTLIRRAAKAEPDNAPVQFWLGEISTFKARASGFGLAAFGAARRAKSGFARAVRLRPDDPDYLQGFAEFLDQAPGIVGGDRDSAWALASHLYTIDRVRGTVVLADILRHGNEGARGRADSLITALVAAHPANPVALGGAGNYYALTGRPALGIPLLQRLVAQDSTNGPARFGLARLLVMEGSEPRQAQLELRFVLAHVPEIVAEAGTPGAPGRRFWFSPAGAWLLLGDTYRQLGAADSARDCFDEALKLNPGSRGAKAGLDSLR
jgi:tetratricopeptide (TPR) repeat protein